MTHSETDRDMPANSLPRAAAGGIVAAAAALAAPELLGLLLGAPSLVAAVGAAVIDLQPPGAKDFVVALFGEADKLALELTVVLAALVIGAGLGIVARRSYELAMLGYGAAGVAGFAAAVTDPQVSVFAAALAAGVSVAAAAVVLARLVPAVRTTGDKGEPRRLDWGRRRFLLEAGAVGVVAAVGGVGARFLVHRRAEQVTETAGSYPPPGNDVAVPSGAELGIAGLTPVVVPNEEFYRIDTALLVPVVDPATWRLRIHGMVDRETELTFPELLGLPMVEQFVTIACVSNEVGGRLVGNAKWTGVPLRDVLDLAGVQAGASQLVGRSVDGWTAGMPTAWVLDPAREPLIAVRMNDEPLPAAHGFPARLIVPGLYGYVSATKWLSELELTTMEAFDAYWVPLGWAKEAPILTQSRIDVPRNGRSVPAGRVVIAGVAWALDRGIRRVEVAIDGTWHDATLATQISDATWVQWQFEWTDATPGSHELRVRATDGTGEVQTAERTRPDPDGARGHHTIRVEVG